MGYQLRTPEAGQEIANMMGDCLFGAPNASAAAGPDTAGDHA